MNKHPLKSKTILCALAIILIAGISLLGIGEKPAAITYDNLGVISKVNQIEKSKWLIVAFAAAGVIYGRYTAKESEGKKDEN